MLCVFSQFGCESLVKESIGEVRLLNEEEVRKVLIKLGEEGRLEFEGFGVVWIL